MIERPKIEVKIEQSMISGKYLCALSIEGLCTDRVITVWTTRKRAKKGSKNIKKIFSAYSLADLHDPIKFREAIDRLDDDDDEFFTLPEFMRRGGGFAFDRDGRAVAKIIPTSVLE